KIGWYWVDSHRCDSRVQAQARFMIDVPLTCASRFSSSRLNSARSSAVVAMFSMSEAHSGGAGAIPRSGAGVPMASSSASRKSPHIPIARSTANAEQRDVYAQRSHQRSQYDEMK